VQLVREGALAWLLLLLLLLLLLFGCQILRLEEKLGLSAGKVPVAVGSYQR
jgi:hypothetical protein